MAHRGVRGFWGPILVYQREETRVFGHRGAASKDAISPRKHVFTTRWDPYNRNAAMHARVCSLWRPHPLSPHASHAVQHAQGRPHLPASGGWTPRTQEAMARLSGYPYGAASRCNLSVATRCLVTGACSEVSADAGVDLICMVTAGRTAALACTWGVKTSRWTR